PLRCFRRIQMPGGSAHESPYLSNRSPYEGCPRVRVKIGWVMAAVSRRPIAAAVAEADHRDSYAGRLVRSRPSAWAIIPTRDDRAALPSRRSAGTAPLRRRVTPLVLYARPRRRAPLRS